MNSLISIEGFNVQKKRARVDMKAIILALDITPSTEFKRLFIWAWSIKNPQ